MSPCILFKNNGDSFPILGGDGRIVSFPWEHASHKNSWDCKSYDFSVDGH